MLALQLCVLDYKLRIKVSKKAHSVVLLSKISSLFVKKSVCDALSLLHKLFNDISECVTP